GQQQHTCQERAGADESSDVEHGRYLSKACRDRQEIGSSIPCQGLCHGLCQDFKKMCVRLAWQKESMRGNAVVLLGVELFAPRTHFLVTAAARRDSEIWEDDMKPLVVATFVWLIAM